MTATETVAHWVYYDVGFEPTLYWCQTLTQINITSGSGGGNKLEALTLHENNKNIL